MTVERYRAFGLEIASEIELSVFAPGRSNEVDVEIRLAERLSDPEDAEAMRFRNWIARPGLMVLDVPDVARFRIEDGRRILVEPAKGRTPADAVPGPAARARCHPRDMRRGDVRRPCKPR